MTVYIPYDGVIKQLMYEVGAIATKGKPLVMVEVEGGASEGGHHLEYYSIVNSLLDTV